MNRYPVKAQTSQVSIPVPVREEFGWRRGEILDVGVGEGGKIIVSKTAYSVVGPKVIYCIEKKVNGEWKILEKLDVPEDEAKLTYRNYRAMNHYKNELRFMRYATYGE